MSGKVFGVGFHKTGTTTLYQMLKRLRYSVCPEKIGYKLMDSWYKGDYTPIVRTARTYSGFQDTPWCLPGTYKVLAKEFPQAKFILTHRENDRWFESMCANYKRLCLPTGRFDYKKNGLFAPDQYYEKVYGFIPTHYDDFLENKNKMIAAYVNHNNEVIEYFTNTRLLVVNWETGTGWKDIIRSRLPWNNLNPDRKE